MTAATTRLSFINDQDAFNSLGQIRPDASYRSPRLYGAGARRQAHFSWVAGSTSSPELGAAEPALSSELASANSASASVPSASSPAVSAPLGSSPSGAVPSAYSPNGVSWATGTRRCRQKERRNCRPIYGQRITAHGFILSSSGLDCNGRRSQCGIGRNSLRRDQQ